MYHSGIKLRQKLVLSLIILFCGLSILHSMDASAAGLRYRYAYSADGYNQDRDDVAGSAMVVAIFDRLGWGDRLVHFHFNTNFGGKPTHAPEHRKSVLWTAKLFGLDADMNDIREFFMDDVLHQTLQYTCRASRSVISECEQCRTIVLNCSELASQARSQEQLRTIVLQSPVNGLLGR